jgi:hypothetical protein
MLAPMADRLAQYFAATQRFSPQLGGRDGVRGRVDAIVNELELPATLDSDGDWRFTTDVGTLLLIWHDDTRKLRALQFIEKLSGRPKGNADILLGLLRLNMDAETACFAVAKDGGEDYVAITGLLPEAEITREEVERVVEDVMRLSRQLDEVLGNVPKQPGADGGAGGQGGAPASDIPAGWYSDPQGQARLRYWDGAQWTEHTAE